MIKVRMIGAAILGSGLFAVGAAEAVDDKIFPGAVCQANSSAGVYQSDGSLRNSSSNLFFATCALTRDNVSNLTGLSDLEVAVTPGSDVVGCYALSLTRFGSSVKTVYKERTGSQGLIDFGSTVNAGQVYGTYVLYCGIGASGPIHSIRTSEY